MRVGAPSVSCIGAGASARSGFGGCWLNPRSDTPSSRCGARAVRGFLEELSAGLRPAANARSHGAGRERLLRIASYTFIQVRGRCSRLKNLLVLAVAPIGTKHTVFGNFEPDLWSLQPIRFFKGWEILTNSL